VKKKRLTSVTVAKPISPRGRTISISAALNFTSFPWDLDTEFMACGSRCIQGDTCKTPVRARYGADIRLTCRMHCALRAKGLTKASTDRPAIARTRIEAKWIALIFLLGSTPCGIFTHLPGSRENLKNIPFLPKTPKTEREIGLVQAVLCSG
jgi:hypothetical protein